MRNIKPDQFKTCIFMSIYEFEKMIKENISEDIIVDYDIFDGIDFSCDDDKFDNEGYLVTDNILKKIAEYFDVKEISSIHVEYIDNEGYFVWICYND